MKGKGGRPKTPNSSHVMSEQIGDAVQGEPEDDQFFLDDPFVFWTIMIGGGICVAILIGCFAIGMGVITL